MILNALCSAGAFAIALVVSTEICKWIDRKRRK
jgi:hypothetical protein